jgi:hypothetical protein
MNVRYGEPLGGTGTIDMQIAPLTRWYRTVFQIFETCWSIWKLWALKSRALAVPSMHCGQFYVMLFSFGKRFSNKRNYFHSLQHLLYIFWFAMLD